MSFETVLKNGVGGVGGDFAGNGAEIMYLGDRAEMPMLSKSQSR